jgi:hypothetical protein
MRLHCPNGGQPASGRQLRIPSSVSACFRPLGGLWQNNTNQKPISQMVLKLMGAFMSIRRNIVAKTGIWLFIS